MNTPAFSSPGPGSRARSMTCTRALVSLLLVTACQTTDRAQPAQTQPDQAAPTQAQPGQAPRAAATPSASATGSSPLNSTLLFLSSGRGSVTWRSEPAEIPLNEPFNLRVSLPGGPDSVDSLAVDAIMPAHRHGMLRAPRIRVLGDDEEGSFMVEGMLFHMTGLWELHFDLTRGAITERAQQDITLE